MLPDRPSNGDSPAELPDPRRTGGDRIWPQRLTCLWSIWTSSPRFRSSASSRRPSSRRPQKLFKEVSFAKDDVVIRIGEPGDIFYVVLDGELEVWDASQPPRQTGTLRRGDYFGEMALLQGGKRTATVTVARRAQPARHRQAGVRPAVPEEPEGDRVLRAGALEAPRRRHARRAHPAGDDDDQRGQSAGA